MTRKAEYMTSAQAIAIPYRLDVHPDAMAIKEYGVPEYLRVMASHGIKANRDADYEDSVEMILRESLLLEKATERGFAVYGYHDKKMLMGYDFVSLNEKAKHDQPSELLTDAKSILLKSAITFDGIRKDCQLKSLTPDVVDYHFSSVFSKYAGRKIILCRTIEGDESERVTYKNLPYYKTILDGAMTPVIIKLVGGKPKQYPIMVPDQFKEQCKHIIHSEMSDSDIFYAHYQSPNCISLLQEPIVDIIGEWRFFVVNHHIVSGSVTEPQLLPFDKDVYEINHVAIKSPQMKLAHETASVIIDDFQKEGLMPSTYVLDIFVTKDMKSGIMELNPINRSGFYACDAERIIKSLIDNL